MAAIDPRANSTNRSGRDTIRTGTSAEAIAEALVDNLRCLQAKQPRHATRNDWYMALAYTIRDRMLDRYITTVDVISGADVQRLTDILAGRATGGDDDV